MKIRTWGGLSAILLSLFISSFSYGGRQPAPSCVDLLALRGPEKWGALEKYYSKTDSAEDFTEAVPKKWPSLIKMIPDGAEGYATKILLLRRAKYSIDISTYMFARDRVTQSMMQEMKDALDRGVNIRILFDAFSTKRWVYSDMRALTSYKSPNPAAGKIEFRAFNPVTDFGSTLQRMLANAWNLFAPEEKRITPEKTWINRRLHDKFIIIDNDYPDTAMALFGGRNLYEKPHGVPNPTPRSYSDMEVLVKNAPGMPNNKNVTSDMTAYFDRMYYRPGNRIITNLMLGVYEPDPSRQDAIIADGHEQMTAEGTRTGDLIKKMDEENFLDTGFDSTETKFVHDIQNVVKQNMFVNWILRDKINKDKNGAAVLSNFEREVVKAKHSIVIAVPYFYLTRAEIKWLRNWLDEDSTRTLTLVGNSISTTDNFMAQLLSDFMTFPAFKESLMWRDKNDQVKIYCYGKIDDARLGGPKNYGLFHGKMAVIDNDVAFVGTHNSDPRSRDLDSEMGGIFYGEGAAAQTMAKINSVIADSYVWGSDDWLVLRYKGLSAVKSLMSPLLYVVFRITGIIYQF